MPWNRKFLLLLCSDHIAIWVNASPPSKEKCERLAVKGLVARACKGFPWWSQRGRFPFFPSFDSRFPFCALIIFTYFAWKVDDRDGGTVSGSPTHLLLDIQIHVSWGTHLGGTGLQGIPMVVTKRIFPLLLTLLAALFCALLNKKKPLSLCCALFYAFFLYLTWKDDKSKGKLRRSISLSFANGLSMNF